MAQKNANIRVVVAMSGGVDSSVAAALLVEQGYDVVGMMLRLWSEETVAGGTHNRCCTPDQMNDARRIANKLGIPFYAIDAKEVFYNNVVEYFLSQHRQVLTPNPCLECNRHIRFTYLLNNALVLDAQYLATGHYARVEVIPGGEYQLKMGVDTNKDQSYVLSVLTQDKLKHTLFPVGKYTKTEVRELAARFGLPTASKQDSQDLCFLGDGDYRRFLAEHAPESMQPGPIQLKTGEVIGQHDGLANYTIGQRRSLKVSYSHPLYVLAMNTAENTLVVGKYDELGESQLSASRVTWVSDQIPSAPFRAQVKIRYRSKPAKAVIEPIGNDRLIAKFDTPQFGVSPGQGAVLYDDDTCLGGGIIERQDDA
jgi:tRNA-uridine 2-sulfurtransferase